MNKEKFFKQLKDEIHGHPFRDRFLEELQDHAEDLENDKELKTKFIESEMIKKYLGEPKDVSRKFKFMMNPWNQALTFFLYGFSLFSLYVAWSFLINALLVPWDGTMLKDRPVGTLTRTINDLFESGLASNILLTILMGISVLIVLLRLNKSGRNSIYKILDYAAIVNFFYLGLLIAISLPYVVLFPREVGMGLRPFSIILHFLGIGILFYLQYTGFSFQKKSKKTHQKI